MLIFSYGVVIYGKIYSPTINTPYGNCTITHSYNVSEIVNYDVVIISYHTDMSKIISANISRQIGTLWVYFSSESPIANYFNNDPGINMLMSYDGVADIWLPYGRYKLRNIPLQSYDAKFYDKSKMMVAIWAKCDSYRLRHLDELRKYNISVDVMSPSRIKGCGNIPIIRECDRGFGAHNSHYECVSILGNMYKFYFAMENSDCRDYITEKVWHTSFSNNMIPVVWGRKNRFADNLPPNSYINCADFSSTSECADHIFKVANNKDLYNSYHEWKIRYEITDLFLSEPSNTRYNDLCEYAIKNDLKEKRNIDMSIIRDPKTSCDMSYKF